MNTRQKGNKNELRCERILQEQGRLTHRAGYTKFKNNDYFKLFDILAIQEGFLAKPLLIQVKTNRLPPKELVKRIQYFHDKYGQYFSCQVWVFYDYRQKYDIIDIQKDAITKRRIEV